MLDLARNSSREGEIVEVLLSNGWDYMRQLISGSKAGEPELPPPAVLRNILTDLGPVYVKLGQLLSTRPDLLPDSYLEALSSLQSNVPPIPAADIEQFVRRELPVPPEEAFQTLNYTAIAAGSIGQTHRATLNDGREVAVKVQRPGIISLVGRDIELIKNIAQLVAATQFGRRFDVVALADEFTRALEAELDFTREAYHTEKLRKNLDRSRWFDRKKLVVPSIHWPLTTAKILVMDWLDGESILDSEAMRQGDRGRDAVTLLVRAFMQQYLVDGFFHADPHPGNLFAMRDGRVGILDCGMVGNLDPRTRGILTELLVAILNGDPKRCAKISLEMTEPVGPIDLIRLEKDYGKLLRRYYNLTLAELDTSEAFQQILQAGVRNNLRWPGSIGLFAKSMTNLEGTARKLHPELDFEKELEPLMPDLFRLQILGDSPLEAALQSVLEFKNLSLSSPRQFSFLLDRLSSETLRLNVSIPEAEQLRRNISESANRRTFGTVLSALIIGTAILGSGQQTVQVQLFSNVLFGAMAVLGLWLLVSILRSGQWR